jgi:hypothetical protein
VLLDGQLDAVVPKKAGVELDTLTTRCCVSNETVACGIPGPDQLRQEVRATTLQADVEPLVWEWSDRWGFATNFAYRADR